MSPIAILFFILGSATFPGASNHPPDRKRGSSPLWSRACGLVAWAAGGALFILEQGWTVGLALAIGAGMMSLGMAALMLPLLAGRRSARG